MSTQESPQSSKFKQAILRGSPVSPKRGAKSLMRKINKIDNKILRMKAKRRGLMAELRRTMDPESSDDTSGRGKPSPYPSPDRVEVITPAPLFAGKGENEQPFFLISSLLDPRMIRKSKTRGQSNPLSL